VGHVATVAVNAALVASQWQQRALTFPCTLPFKHEARQATSAVLQVFRVTRPGIERRLPALVARDQPTVPLTSPLNKWE